MAFDHFAKEDEEEKGTGSDVGGLVGKPLGENSPVVTGNAKPEQAPGEGTSSGSFTNLQKYLDVNASLNQGGRVAGKTQEEVNAATAAQNQADTGFRAKVDNNTVKLDENLLNQAKVDPTKFFTQPKTELPQQQIETKPQKMNFSAIRPDEVAAPAGTIAPTVPPPVGPEGPSFSTQESRPAQITTLPKKYDFAAEEQAPVASQIETKPITAPPRELQAAAESAANAPQPLVGNADYENFVKMRDAKYGGPKSLVDEAELYNPAQQLTEKAREAAAATDSAGGRKALLDKYFGSGVERFNYTEGQKKLDNLLISQDPTARDAFQQVRDSSAQAGGNFDSLKAALEGYAGQGAAATSDARAKTRDLLGIDDAGTFQNRGVIQDDLGRIDQSVQARLDELAREKGVIASTKGIKDMNQLTAEQRQLMGNFDPSQIAATNVYKDDGYNTGWNVGSGYGYNVDASQYGAYVPEVDLNRGTVGTSQDMARIEALSKLAGLQQNFISNPDQAGLYSEGPLSQYKQDQFLNDVLGSRANYSGEMQGLLKNYQSQGGLTNAPDLQKGINNIRERWALDRVGSEVGAVGSGYGAGPVGGAPVSGNPLVTPIGGPVATPTPPPTNYNPGQGVGYTNPGIYVPPRNQGPIGGGTGPIRRR